MSAMEHGDVEHVATVHSLPSRVAPDPDPKPTTSGLPAVHLPSMAQVADLIQPPDIWSDDRPSLRKLWLYARYGRWTSQTGLLRVLGQLDAFLIVLPPHAIGYTLLWIWERPSRRYVAITLGVLVKLTLF
jgi:hypothetical protein